MTTQTGPAFRIPYADISRKLVAAHKRRSAPRKDAKK